MRRLFALANLLALLLAAACGSPAPRAAWTYAGDSGPSHWGDLDPAYAAARDGHAQSPIDVRTADARPGGARLAVDYDATPLEVLNNGHTVEVDYHGAGRLVAGGREYQLRQFHFHSPSEHTVDGEHAAIEMHLVHADPAGDLAVVGVLFEEGAEHAAFAALAEHFPADVTPATPVAGATVDADDYLPASLAAWSYDGSLTTPPCTEGVAWFLLQEPVEVSAEQVLDLRRIVSGNNRPTQPLHGRAVTATP